MGEGGYVGPSEEVFALNELSESDFNTVMSAPPGTYHFYAVSAGWVPTEEYSEMFDALHESGAVDRGENLASALFHRKKSGSDDFVPPHQLVVEARLPSVPLKTPTYVFAVSVMKHRIESVQMVRSALCKMLGYDKDNEKNTVEKIKADVAHQAALNDALLLPTLQHVEHYGDADDIDGAAFAAAADEAEKQHAQQQQQQQREEERGDEQD
jgi:hypothetical protein